jgi:cytochrome oxidase Cu insertion factor (SCO1/SenC/PrrC family)
MSKAQRNGLVAFAIGLAILAGAFVYEFARLERGEGLVAGVAIGGPFTLVDQTGATRRDAEFRGKLMLVYFGYTYCPDICPTELATMSEALERLGDKAAGVQPLFITVDPARDTPEQLRLYGESFDPRFLMLTGSEVEIAEVARAYKVYYRITRKSDGEIQVDHSSFVYLMGRDGRYLAHFASGTSPEAMAAAIAGRL